MRILSRRFLASYLCALVAIAAGTLLALAIVDMLVDFDAVVEGGAAALAALVARAPQRHLAELLPLASGAAAFLATALPSRRGELLAICAAGIHPARATLPVLVAALAVAAASPWLPGAREAEAATAGDGAWHRADGAWHRSGDRFFARGPDAARGAELALFEVDARFRLRRSLHAAEVRDAGPAWELGGARLLRFDPEAPDAAPRDERPPARLAAPPASADAAPGLAQRARPVGLALLACAALPLGLRVRPARGLTGTALAALAGAAAFRGAWQAVAFAAERD
ncbi:MAG TPA: hypothetical protein VFC77_12650, partial [Myxococcota bacterium]|nr:hypothetical protein [Myxococcota bacterium]